MALYKYCIIIIISGGLGRSPSRNRICCILALKSVIWWQQF